MDWHDWFPDILHSQELVGGYHRPPQSFVQLGEGKEREHFFTVLQADYMDDLGLKDGRWCYAWRKWIR